VFPPTAHPRSGRSPEARADPSTYLG
jgi:hypothetical protein